MNKETKEELIKLISEENLGPQKIVEAFRLIRDALIEVIKDLPEDDK